MPIQCTCPICGATFFRPPSHARPVTCSPKCGAILSHSAPRWTDVAARFWKKVTKGEHWLWEGWTDKEGYGRLDAWGQSSLLAHRVAWMLATDTISLPSNVHILHTCDIPACVRNDDVGTYDVGGIRYERRGHLWLGDHAANMADRESKGRGGPTVHPERMARGVEHWTRRTPERAAHGMRSGTAKLTDEQVIEIRRRAATGEVNRRLAEEFGVQEQAISKIVHYQRWKHLP